MPRYASTLKCTVMTPDSLVYEDEVHSVFLTGNQGEYELLPYHYPTLGILIRGNIIIDWKLAIPIVSGVVRFFANDCIILVEQEEREKKEKAKEDDDMVFADEKETEE